MKGLGIALAFVVISIWSPCVTNTKAQDPFIYRLEQPDAVHRLHESLREVSGLSWTPAGHLAAIEDEHGILYTLNPTSGEILDRFRFGSDRDYEAVEYAGGRVWVLESDGDLYAFHTEGKRRLRRHATDLDASNDTEGLTMLPDGRLLLLCKELPGADVAGRALWTFDPASKELSDEPWAVLPGTAFKPSGVAVHPATHDIYMVSSRPPAMLIMSPEGVLKSTFRLEVALMTQPEGIAIAPDGTMYIASEGGPGRGHLFLFRPVTSDK